ncbi:MAG: molybdopterin-dependent oxidoreductase, partial [Proteobacteria bacterium]|nr:molybdopterin-dependent oxidoreductase [Pseudomonadota bacterium]
MPARATASSAPTDPRRALLQLLGLGSAGLGLGVSVFARGYAFAADVERDEAHRFLTVGTRKLKGARVSEITPNERFYLTTCDGDREVDASAWALRVEGWIERPLTLTLADLTAAMDETAAATLTCVGNPVGGNAIGDAAGEGVTLKQAL